MAGVYVNVRSVCVRMSWLIVRMYLHVEHNYKLSIPAMQTSNNSIQSIIEHRKSPIIQHLIHLLDSCSPPVLTRKNRLLCLLRAQRRNNRTLQRLHRSRMSWPISQKNTILNHSNLVSWGWDHAMVPRLEYIIRQHRQRVSQVDNDISGDRFHPTPTIVAIATTGRLGAVVIRVHDLQATNPCEQHGRAD